MRGARRVIREGLALRTALLPAFTAEAAFAAEVEAFALDGIFATFSSGAVRRFSDGATATADVALFCASSRASSCASATGTTRATVERGYFAADGAAARADFVTDFLVAFAMIKGSPCTYDARWDMLL